MFNAALRKNDPKRPVFSSQKDTKKNGRKRANKRDGITTGER
jgi:hypothetical protein